MAPTDPHPSVPEGGGPAVSPEYSGTSVSGSTPASPDNRTVSVPIAASNKAAEGRPQGDYAAMRLGMVLQLARRAKRAGKKELPFVLVNETRQLLPYRQAVLWVVRGGTPALEALSGLATVDRQSPYAAWMGAFAKHTLSSAFAANPADGKGAASLAKTQPMVTVRFSLEAAAAAGTAEGSRAKGGTFVTADTGRMLPGPEDYEDFVPGQAMAAALYDPAGQLCGYLCLFRKAPFSEGEEQLFSHLAESYGDSLGGGMMRPRKMPPLSKPRLVAAIAAVLLLAVMFVPRPQSGLAGAEVVARQPVIVRAEVDGVVDGILVESNQRVSAGDPLLRLEDTQLKTRLAVAEKAGEMAQVELRQLQQAALYDGSAKARLPLAQGRVDQLQAEAEYVRSLLERVVSTSPMDGVALVDNPGEWRGRPVSLGQKIMMVADPDDVMLEIHLPAADALPLAVGDDLLFFPNIAPSSPVRARITSVGYRAVDTPGVGMAFHLRAEFSDSAPMLGLRGTARLHASSLPLGVIILRRPIMAVRQWMGW